MYIGVNVDVNSLLLVAGYILGAFDSQSCALTTRPPGTLIATDCLYLTIDV